MGVSLKSPQMMTDGNREDATSRAMVSACGARIAEASASLCTNNRAPLFTFSFSGAFNMSFHKCLCRLLSVYWTPNVVDKGNCVFIQFEFVQYGTIITAR